MQITKITPENVHEFPVGSIVISNYGAGYPDIEGVIIGHEIRPATKFFPADALLHVRQENFIGEDGEYNVIETSVSQLYETDYIGPIGTYLVEKAEKPTIENNSPWAITS
jgi:hypothetical protein